MKTLAKMILVAALLLSPFTAQAGEGGAGPGGGNGVGNRLFDFYDAETLTRLDVQNTQPFKKVLQPILSDIKSKLPNLGERLEEALKEKRWVLDAKPLASEGCLNKTLSGVKKTVIACQNAVEVRIKKQWFTSDKVTTKDKAGLILHELLRTFELEDYSVHALTVGLFQSRSMDENQLQQMIQENLASQSVFGTAILTRSNVCSHIQDFKNGVQKSCGSSPNYRGILAIAERHLGDDVGFRMLGVLHKYYQTAGAGANDAGACAVATAEVNKLFKNKCE